MNTYCFDDNYEMSVQLIFFNKIGSLSYKIIEYKVYFPFHYLSTFPLQIEISNILLFASSFNVFPMEF